MSSCAPAPRVHACPPTLTSRPVPHPRPFFRHQAYQYLLFAAEPYETIAFKLQSREVDKGQGRMFVYWDRYVPPSRRRQGDWRR